MSQWFEIVMYISMLTVFIPLACCIYRIRQLNASLYIVFFFLLFSTAIELGSFYINSRGQENYTFRHLFTVVESCSLGLIYLLEYRSKLMRSAILLLFAVFVFAAWYVLIYKQGYAGQDNILLSTEAGMMLVLSGLYFLKLLRSRSINKLSDFYFIWINLGVFFYFSLSFFVFLFDFYLEKCPEELAYSLWGIHSFGNMLYHIFIAIGIWKISKFGRS